MALSPTYSTSCSAQSDITKYTLMQYLDNCDSIDLNEAEKLVKYKNCVILFMSPNDISVLENNLKKLLEL